MRDFFLSLPEMHGMLLFLNISGGEILLIIVVIYLVFGPKKIPELARMLGKGINEMRRATDEIKNEITREISNAKKDINLDIDQGDPLGIKKTVEETMNSPKPPVPPKPTKKQEADKGSNKENQPLAKKTSTKKASSRTGTPPKKKGPVPTKKNPINPPD